MQSVFCFDEFELDVEAQQLKRAGDVVKVDGLVLRLLEVFVRNPGKLLSKEELVAVVWNGRLVSENALTVAVARMRKALEIDRGVREVLLTVQGRGYRFLRAVSTREPEVVDSTGACLPEGTAPFVGRQAVITQLKQALAQARAGHGGLIVLRGEPGIGKTRVAEVFAHHAKSAGHMVAWGYCRELGDTPPLWPVAGLLREVLSQLPEATRSDPRFRALLPELSVLLPELAAQGAYVPPEPSASQAAIQLPPKLRVFDAVTRALIMAAEIKPAVLIMDDLHRADEPSYELLQYVLAELSRARVLIIATMRSSSEIASDSPVARVLGHRNCIRVSLPRLDELEVAQYMAALFGADVDAPLCRAVLRISEGNAFYMTELARQLRSAAKLNVAALTVPGLALDLVRQRLAGLPQGARQVLSYAAVLGRSFSLALLSAVTGRSASDLMPGVDAAIACEVLRPSHSAAMVFLFAHDLLRSALYEELSSSEQRSRHLRVLQVLDQRRPLFEVPAADLAYHARRALPQGDLHRAVQHCTEAANDAVRLYAFTDAIRYLQYAREALDLMPDASPQLRFGLLMRQAALVRAHCARDFLPLAEQLLRVAREQRSSPSLGYATLLLDPFPGFPRLPLLRGALEDALANLPTDSPKLRAALLARLAGSAPLAYDSAKSAKQLEHALELAAHSPEPADRFSARFGELYLYGGPAHAARAALALEALQRLCDGHGSPPLPAVLMELHRALCALQAGALSTMTRALDRCEARCRDLDMELLWHVERFLAIMRIEQGDATGRGQLQALERRASESIIGSELFCVYDQIVVLETGELSSEQLGTLMPDSSDPPNIWALKVRALAAAGVMDEAKRALALVPAERLAHLPCDREFLGTLGALARAALQLRADDHGRAIYALLKPYPEHFAANLSFHCEGSVSLLLGLLAQSFGDRVTARQHLELAIVMSERAGFVRCAAAARLERNRC